MKTFLAVLLITASFINVTAQKLPNIQQAGLKAPENIKIDGKATEWGKFNAFNGATDVFYSIANNEKHLYLIVQTTSYNITIKLYEVALRLP